MGKGDEMKKVIVVAIAVLIGLSLTACGDSTTQSYDLSKVTFVTEPDPSFLGSYRVERCDLNYRTICWDEWGEWSSALELALDSNTSICVGSGKAATFRARSDYQWEQTDNCFSLEKR